jgi:PhoPQ-activated pathogenicity-related protein
MQILQVTQNTMVAIKQSPEAKAFLEPRCNVPHRRFVFGILAALGVLLCLGSVAQAQEIISQPTNLTVCAGSPATFTVEAAGDGWLYQWEVSADNGVNWETITDGVGPSYTINVTSLADNAMQFHVFVGTDYDGLFSDPVVLTVNAAATASAGTNQTISAGSSTAGLGGTVGGAATGGAWTSSGTGNFAPNATTLNATYSPSAADITAGSVTLTLSSTGQVAPCSAATAQVAVAIHTAATAGAGGNQTICAGHNTAGLRGSVGGSATGGLWSSSGTGTFAPNATTLNATYSPSSDDVVAHTVTLRLTAQPWADATAQVVVTINPTPGTPTTVGDTRSGPGLVILKASGSGGTLKWYSNPSLTTRVNTGPTYGPTVSATTNYYVTETSTLGCVSAASPVTATILPIATQLDAASVRSNAQMKVTIKGGMRRWHSLEASTNLLNWSAVTNLYQANPSSDWMVAGISNFPQRYFRSRDLTTALDRYVAEPDTNFSYSLKNTIADASQTTYVLELRSQAWLTANEVTRTLWKHWLVIVKPTGVTNSQALLFIDGGSNPGTQPTAAEDVHIIIAISSQTVIAQLKMVPNEPLTFVGDEASSRSEDGIIAYSWDKYMKTGDERWPARLPMTKAAVRAMDTVTAFCASPSGGGLTVDKFVVAGGSKRGWTSWTTAAVDQRVVGIIPASIDVLNMEACMMHQYCAYGFWADAVGDYTTMGIMTNVGTPRFEALMNIEDPYAYRARLTMPKFEIFGAGDQYFLPDSSQFYFHDLPGVKYMCCVPNADHGLNDAAYFTVLAYYQALVTNLPLPQFTWSLQSSNVLQVVATNPPPDAVNLWQAMTTTTNRDFRLVTIGTNAWQSTVLVDQGGGVYLGSVSTPAQGWKAFFVELNYNRTGSGLLPLKFTTQVYVVPDTLPHTWPPPP